MVEKEGVSQKKERRNFRRIIIFSAIVIGIILIAFLGTKAYLYFRVLVGNDLVLTVHADQENFLVSNHNVSEATFETTVTTNPFCTAECSYDWKDVNTQQVLEHGDFTLAVPTPSVHTELITTNHRGEGQDLYAFTVTCVSTRTVLCQTSQKPKTRTILVTINYILPSDAIEIKTNTRAQIEHYAQLSAQGWEEFQGLATSVSMLNRTSAHETLRVSLMNVSTTFQVFNASLMNAARTWEEERYEDIVQDLSLVNITHASFEDALTQTNTSVSHTVERYNAFSRNVSELFEQLQTLNQRELTNTTAELLNQTIHQYHQVLSDLGNASFESQEPVVQSLLQQARTLEQTPIQEPFVVLNTTLIPPMFFLLALPSVGNTTSVFELHEPASQCCFQGACGACCTNTCAADQEKYPIIFLHGHDFNKAISAEYSLDTFQKMQQRLESDGYINAGTITLNAPNTAVENVWGRTRQPVTVSASYYFDLYREPTEDRIIQAKAESIENYAIRLRDIIDTVRFKTGKDKVIIIAHSMGGLVTRRYMQIFGDQAVDSVIFIATPHHGISGSIKDRCEFFGAQQHCGDMYDDSLLINKLETGVQPSIPLYNIVGVGCDVDGETGDGVAKNSSAYLMNATTFYIQGTCFDSFSYLHTQILDPDIYPQTYETITTILKNRSL